MHSYCIVLLSKASGFTLLGAFLFYDRIVRCVNVAARIHFCGFHMIQLSCVVPAYSRSKTYHAKGIVLVAFLPL